MNPHKMIVVGVVSMLSLSLACVRPVQEPTQPLPPQAPPAQSQVLATEKETANELPSPSTTALEESSSQPGKRSLDQATEHLRSLHVAFYSPRHKNNKTYQAADGYLAPVAGTADGGFLFGGQAELDGQSRPVIGKIDTQGDLLWQVPMDKPIYRAYEGGLVNETPDGNYVGHIMSYVDPALNPTHSFAKITASGAVLWRLDLPRDEHGNSPQIHLGKIAPDSSIMLSGHLYEGARGKQDRPAYGWTGRITPDGKLTDNSSSAPIDWAKDEW